MSHPYSVVVAHIHVYRGTLINYKFSPLGQEKTISIIVEKQRKRAGAERYRGGQSLVSSYIQYIYLYMLIISFFYSF